MKQNLLANKTRKNGLIYFLLALIVVLGFFIRTYKLDKIPAGFFCDEAITGYKAYLLITQGKDAFGGKLPIFFNTFGSFRPGIPFYTTVPFVALLGLNEFSVRLTSAVIGSLTIIIIYFLSKKIFSSKLAGVFAAFLLAISPWHIHFSRYGAENIYLPFFMSLGTLFFIYFIDKEELRFSVLSFIFFGMSLYTYTPAYFLIPIFITLILCFYLLKIKDKKQILIGLFVFLIICIPLIIGIRNGQTLARLNQMEITNNKTKPEMIKGFFVTYFNHFSPKFLFEKGDIQFPGHYITRFSVRGLGELYWFQLPLILIGFFFFIKKKKYFFLILSWLIIYPLGSSAMPFSDGGGPLATRSIIGVIPFQILTASGIFYLILALKKKYLKIALAVILSIIIFISLNSYLNKYFVKYNNYSSNFWGWQYGAKEIVNFFEFNQDKYQELIMSPDFNGPDIFFKFYSPNNCKKCKIGLPDGSYNPKLKQLFALPPYYLKINPGLKFITLKNIYYPNGGVAFEIGEIVE
ncbi:MAG: glycosyltransferase family 39 protein [Cyanobacteria bacterium]|nr:glycosyltransferase family 39 protein [Cyanobacteriota bacterium]